MTGNGRHTNYLIWWMVCKIVIPTLHCKRNVISRRDASMFDSGPLAQVIDVGTNYSQMAILGFVLILGTFCALPGT